MEQILSFIFGLFFGFFLNGILDFIIFHHDQKRKSGA